LGADYGYTYGRTNNPTREILESNLASLENASYGIAFSSGVAAIHSLSILLNPGDNIIVSKSIYGGTYRLFENIFKKSGISFKWVSTNEINKLDEILTESTKLVYIETPSNPLLTITDIGKISSFCKNNNLLLVVDNTFMTPYFQNPINYGADIIIHSCTKYINGHSDLIGGVVLVNDKKLSEKIKYFQNAAGAIPSPFECWLMLRSIKTLAVRMEMHQKNAMEIANYLSANDKILKVYYPGLKTHIDHQLASKQMSGFGGVVSIELNNFEITKEFIKKLKLFKLAESLGGVESLLSHPYSMSHKSVDEKEKIKAGINENLVRLSVGLEDIEDLIDDLKNALE